jgi:hypothetical protein
MRPAQTFTMRHARSVASAVLALLLVGMGAACSNAQSPAHIRAVEKQSAQAFDQQATQVLKAWPSAAVAKIWNTGYVPLQELTVMPSDAVQQSVFFGYNDLTFATPMPTTPATVGTVVFADHSTLAVPVQSWTQTKADLDVQNYGPVCATPPATLANTCRLTVTRITLGTTTLLTSRGEAKVPAWLMTTRQLLGPIARVAVPTPTMGILPISSPYDGHGIDGTFSLGSIDGAHVRFTLIAGVCDQRITPRAVETPTAVVIGATTANTFTGNCVAAARFVAESLTLKAPLGNRALLDINNGYPLRIGEDFRKDLH